MSRKKIDWLNHGLEFIVVVVGILIAFQLNTCSSERTQRKIIDKHLIQIQEETAVNKASLELAITTTEENIILLDSMITWVLLEKNISQVNLYSLRLLNVGLSYFRKNAFNSLIETGDIRLMTEGKTKHDIINLYEYYKWVESFNEITMALYESDYYPYLRDNMELLEGRIQDKSVYTSFKYKNILGAYIRTSKNRLKKYKECMEVINEYLEGQKEENRY